MSTFFVTFEDILNSFRKFCTIILPFLIHNARSFCESLQDLILSRVLNKVFLYFLLVLVSIEFIICMLQHWFKLKVLPCVSVETVSLVSCHLFLLQLFFQFCSLICLVNSRFILIVLALLRAFLLVILSFVFLLLFQYAQSTIPAVACFGIFCWFGIVFLQQF